ncbi:MAG TPA: 4-(cytidine 5'-diphospho)-2-C-methyl-D-erythritol kinase [Ignavibacteriaceae bacterium]|nr:4-(cytidine 5'-diphospho)-2-C-methyl-D-erythritol kinase [Ignavibacteriaceae bacterium]
MDEIAVKSPAKINIGLNIINKRDDGFHNLETIFYPINLFDEISFSKSDRFTFNSNDENLNKEKTNLIIRAKELLENEFLTQLPVNIYLKKNIPIGAGLGGGSSNAATTLLSLSKLFNLELSQKNILDLAIKLGSDVPYFLNPVPSFAESRGEKLFPINFRIKKYLLIVNPGIHIATKWAFSLITPKQPIICLKSLIDKPNIKIEDVMSIATNDFEEIVFKHFHEIKKIKEKMIYFGANYSMMTGTGSTVWAMFDDEEAAYQTELFFKCKNYFTFIQESI